MHLIYLFSLILFPSLYADTYKIQYKLFTYKIEIDKDRIKYFAPQTELSLTNRTCNEHLFNHFLSRLDNLKKRKAKTTSDMNTIEVFHNNEKFHLISTDRHFDYFSNFDQNFKTLKIEENLICHSQ